MFITKRHKAKSLIPVASMADIAFLLLIFFMLSSILEMEKEIPLNLPESRIMKSETAKYFNVYITPDGGFYYNNEAGTADGLVRYARYRATGNSDIKALINADRDISFRYINQALDALKEAGVHSVVMVCKKKSTGGR
ncbi:MAG TPA: biopolymer transporter ExbD [Spirochaetota bacterium]|nr:biopolymer transporter ExbD [Spirochaetota bacterium]HPI89466.1 biopolymer transporter ExbD [Spirochaetota bacterium]HPR49323.1 biopolymer transporter ExbD [Spirochaetota bacterium]